MSEKLHAPARLASSGSGRLLAGCDAGSCRRARFTVTTRLAAPLCVPAPWRVEARGTNNGCLSKREMHNGAHVWAPMDRVGRSVTGGAENPPPSRGDMWLRMVTRYSRGSHGVDIPSGTPNVASTGWLARW